VGTRSRMCHRGWDVWVHGGDCAVIYYVEVNIVSSVVSHYVCCRMICTYILNLYVYNVQYHTKCGFCSRSFGFLNLF